MSELLHKIKEYIPTTEIKFRRSVDGYLVIFFVDKMTNMHFKPTVGWDQLKRCIDKKLQQNTFLELCPCCQKIFGNLQRAFCEKCQIVCCMTCLQRHIGYNTVTKTIKITCPFCCFSEESPDKIDFLRIESGKVIHS